MTAVAFAHGGTVAKIIAKRSKSTSTLSGDQADNAAQLGFRLHSYGDTINIGRTSNARALQCD